MNLTKPHPDRLRPSCWRVLLAVYQLYQEGSPITYRALMNSLGWRSPKYVQDAIVELCRRGLVVRSPALSGYRMGAGTIMPTHHLIVIRPERRKS
jgi:hypothetical protein